jgi:hypothetical protein
MTCEQCIHYEICNENADGNIVELMVEPCFRFKDKRRYKEVVYCYECIHRKEWRNVMDGFDVCKLSGLIMVDDIDYCPYGERKTE